MVPHIFPEYPLEKSARRVQATFEQTRLRLKSAFRLFYGRSKRVKQSGNTFLRLCSADTKLVIAFAEFPLRR